MSGARFQPARRNPWQFSLRSLLICAVLFALLLATGAYFGWVGLAIAAIVATIVSTFVLLGREPSLVQLLAAVALIVVVVVLILPAINVSRGGLSRAGRCRIQFRALALAMQNYEQVYGAFPPAYIADDNGTPLHSWRVLLLPFLEEQILYKQYRWDEPWNGPNNSQLAGAFRPNPYQCPSDTALSGTAMTSYVVVGGPETAFPGRQSTKLKDLGDGISRTILIVEIANSGIHWMEPRDLSLQQMATTINAPAGQGVSSAHAGGAQVAYADGYVQFLSDATPPEELRARLTINGGETVTFDQD